MTRRLSSAASVLAILGLISAGTSPVLARTNFHQQATSTQNVPTPTLESLRTKIMALPPTGYNLGTHLKRILALMDVIKLQ